MFRTLYTQHSNNFISDWNRNTQVGCSPRCACTIDHAASLRMTTWCRLALYESEGITKTLRPISGTGTSHAHSSPQTLLSRKPVFVVFPTSTTHAPFGPVAPYQPDWSRMLASDAFAKGDVARAMAATPDLTNLRPSYTHAMAYEYATIAGYLRQHPRDNMVVVALGDHQPAAAVSGRGASWSVPVHVFGRRGPILNRLIEEGFREGLEPHRPPIGPMHALTPMLLQAFSSPTSVGPGRLATQSPVASATRHQLQTTTPATPE